MRLLLLGFLYIPFAVFSQNTSELAAIRVYDQAYTAYSIPRADVQDARESVVGFGLSEKAASVKIHPNPSSSNLYVTLKGSGSDGKVVVYDILGNEIVEGEPFQLTGGSGTWSQNVSSWNPGTYVVRIFQDGEVVKSLRFIKN